MKYFFYKIKEYLYFSSGEQKGIIVLIILIILIAPSPYFYKQFFPVKKFDEKKFLSEMSEFEKKWNCANTLKDTVADTQNVFPPFDPNTVSYSEMKQIGFSSAAIKSIFRYREKKGIFRKKEDLKKIYGMTETFYNEIEPSIIIQHANNQNHAKNEKISSPEMINRIEINSADSAGLVSLKGIGPVLADRIIRYRNKLGGFYSIKQLTEVYGITDSLVGLIIQHTTVDTLLIKRLNINNVPESELAKHPYISTYQARAVLAYRKLQGGFKSNSELIKSRIFPDSLVSRLLPYVKFH